MSGNFIAVIIKYDWKGVKYLQPRTFENVFQKHFCCLGWIQFMLSQTLYQTFPGKLVSQLSSFSGSFLMLTTSRKRPFESVAPFKSDAQTSHSVSKSCSQQTAQQLFIPFLMDQISSILMTSETIFQHKKMFNVANFRTQKQLF